MNCLRWRERVNPSQHELNKVILLEGCPTPCVACGMCVSVRLGRGACCVVVLLSGDLQAKQKVGRRT